jgi:hypothetical protein
MCGVGEGRERRRIEDELFVSTCGVEGSSG